MGTSMINGKIIKLKAGLSIAMFDYQNLPDTASIRCKNAFKPFS
jgi:hypothetical protein